MGFLNNLGSGAIYVIGMMVFMGIYFIGMTIYMKKRKEKNLDWEKENPDAAKVNVKTYSQFIKSAGMYIHSVDSQKPNTFYEMTKYGFYLLPGKHIIEVSFTTNRPGVLHKNVTTTYGPTKLEVEVEKRKSYEISFNEDEQQYLFEEIRG